MLTTTLVLLIALALGIHLATTILTTLRRRSRKPASGARPFVSLVRPVCGIDTFDRETLASSFTQAYPDYEVIFCAATEDDPAVGLARELAAAHPEVKTKVLVGETLLSANPKLNNLAKGLDAARGEIVVMTDSNLLLPEDYLASLDDTWLPETGLVSAPAFGDRPGNFWGAVECAFLNGNQARWQLAADALGLGFAQGKTLAWRRDVLEAGGGLLALGRNLAEDVASTKLVREQGLRVRLPARIFAQPIGKRDARAVWDRQLRWSRVRRDGFPALFAFEIANGPLLPTAALVTLVAMGAAPVWSLLVLLLAWYGAELALARMMGWPGGARDLAAMMTRDALLAPLWLTTFRSRGFTWRGTAMTKKAV